MSDEGDFQTSALDDLENVIGLTPSDPLNTFAEIWYQVFLWALFSSLFLHVGAASVAMCSLRRHAQGRWTALVVVAVGLASLLGNVFTSVAVAFVYRAMGTGMPVMHALCWGVGQTFTATLVSYTRILATL